MEVVDEFWSGMGAALLVMGIVRIFRTYRLNKNEGYREKMEIMASDERLHYIRLKSWSWAGYLFILISAIAVLGFKLMGQELLSMAASWAVCLMLVLFWSANYILNKKY